MKVAVRTLAVTMVAVTTVAVRTLVVTRAVITTGGKTELMRRREARIRSLPETAFQPASATRRQDRVPGPTPG